MTPVLPAHYSAKILNFPSQLVNIEMHHGLPWSIFFQFLLLQDVLVCLDLSVLSIKIFSICISQTSLKPSEVGTYVLLLTGELKRWSNFYNCSVSLWHNWGENMRSWGLELFKSYISSRWSSPWWPFVFKAMPNSDLPFGTKSAVGNTVVLYSI